MANKNNSAKCGKFFVNGKLPPKGPGNGANALPLRIGYNDARKPAPIKPLPVFGGASATKVGGGGTRAQAFSRRAPMEQDRNRYHGEQEDPEAGYGHSRSTRRDLEVLKKDMRQMKSQLDRRVEEPAGGVDAIAKIVAELLVKPRHDGNTGLSLEDGEVPDLERLAAADVTALTVKMIVATIAKIVEEQKDRDRLVDERLGALEGEVVHLQRLGRTDARTNRDAAQKAQDLSEAVSKLRNEVLETNKGQYKATTLAHRDRSVLQSKLDAFVNMVMDLDLKMHGSQNFSHVLYDQLAREKADLLEWTDRYLNALVAGPGNRTTEQLQKYGEHLGETEHRVHAAQDDSNGKKDRLTESVTTIRSIHNQTVEAMGNMARIQASYDPGREQRCMQQPPRQQEQLPPQLQQQLQPRPQVRAQTVPCYDVQPVAGVKRHHHGSEAGPSSDDSFPRAMAGAKRFRGYAHSAGGQDRS